MDKGLVLKIIEVGSRVRVGTNSTLYEYHGMTIPNHTCKEPKPLEPGDVVTVKNMTPTSVLVTGPCGCDYLLWDRIAGEAIHTVNDVVAATTWESLLDHVRQWMIVRFSLNTDRDLWVWVFVIGAASHLEYLAVAVLWVADQKPTPFNEYQPKRTLGPVAHLIRERGLLDPDTLAKLEKIAALRNSVTHRGATYGVPFREDDPSGGEYKGRHVFTDPEGLAQLVDDMDAATKAMGEWLRKAGLGTDEGTPA
jgi:hypothetical protein